MESISNVHTILVTVALVFVDSVFSDSEYMVSIPESRVVPINYDTMLTCEMNIEPDKFQWKFYPSSDPYDPKSNINLSNATYKLVPESKHNSRRKKSTLTLQDKNGDIAGDYQCLAYYGAYVVASVPWRITISILKDFPPQQNTSAVVTIDNTVSWRCLPPQSNPEAYIEYRREDSGGLPQVKSLILTNVSLQDSGIYRCTAFNTVQSVTSNTTFKLDVVRNGPQKAPYFIMEPERSYTVVKGATVFIECSAVGNPVPKVVWFKKNSQLPSDRTEMVAAGLRIRNISSTDDGVYVCNHTNIYGTVSHHVTLIYNEEPSVECLMNNTDIKQEENLDLDCEVKGVPEPQVTWFLNGFSVNNDSAVEAIGNRIYFRPIQKRHAGNLQIFARNIVKTVYSSVSIKVIPLTTTVDVSVTPPHAQSQRHHRRKNGAKNQSKRTKLPKMVPPNKPTISGLSDESVVIRWNVPNNNGLPIQFFKVQYKEVGPANANDYHSRNKDSRWKTTNADIPPNIKDYDVTNLKPDHIYKFRIAAVYSNNHHKLSVVSDKFHLRRSDFDKKNPLPVPLITHTETVNSTSVKIYWECHKSRNVSIDGFYISYISASTAGDYMKATAEGEHTRVYVLSHLLPETVYDVKLQSYNSKLASEFSSIMKAKTGLNPVPQPTTSSTSSVATTPHAETNGISKLYGIIAGGVIGFALVISGVVLLFVCRKWKRNKTAENRDKPAVEEHHIQADSNDYVVGPKSITRSNGCAIPGNRITITSNPLADADNKNQTMMEMRNLTSQNNNTRQEHVTATSASAPPAGEEFRNADSNSIPKKDKCSSKLKKVDNNKRNMATPRENYV